MSAKPVRGAEGKIIHRNLELMIIGLRWQAKLSEELAEAEGGGVTRKFKCENIGS